MSITQIQNYTTCYTFGILFCKKYINELYIINMCVSDPTSRIYDKILKMTQKKQTIQTQPR